MALPPVRSDQDRLLVLIGPPGAGKGTQAQLLIARYRIPHLATGDMLRAARKAGSPIGEKVAAIMDGGNLVPDEVVIELIAERLDDPVTGRRGAIFDGFPRTVPQAEALDRLLGKGGRKLDRALFVDVADAEVVRRTSGRRLCGGCQRPYHIEFNPTKESNVCDACGHELVQRPDDRPERVQARLDSFRRETAPVLGYFEKQGIVRRIDGVGPPEAVFERIAWAIDSD